MKPLIESRPLLVIAALALAHFTGSASAFNPSVNRLYGKHTLPQTHANFGAAVAVSDRWIVVGAEWSDDFGNDNGVVDVFNAHTGRHVRRLAPDDSNTAARFGCALALSGNTVLVGAKGDSENGSYSGAAYLFDLATGRRIAKLGAGPATSQYVFGGSVALSGNLAVVGADRAGSGIGFAYVFDATTGDLITPLQGTGTIASSIFGRSVSICGRIAVVGAPGEASNRGAIFIFDALTGQQIYKEAGDDTLPGDHFGSVVCADGGRILVAAPGLGRGTAYLIEISTGNELRKLEVSNPAYDANFGLSLRLHGNLAFIGCPAPTNSTAFLFDAATGIELSQVTPPGGLNEPFYSLNLDLHGHIAVVGSIHNDDQGENNGTAYVFSPITSPLSLTPVAKTGDFAPGAIDISFRNFTSAFVNPAGAVAFGAGLTGLQSNRGRDTGVWGTFSGFTNVAPLSLSARSRDIVSTVSGMHSIGKLKAPICNQTISTFYEATITGTGVTRANNRVIFRDDDTIPFGVFRTGTPVAGLGGAAISSFSELVQPHTTGGNLALAFQLQRGVAGILSDTDSGLLRASFTGTFQNAFREGALIPGGGGAEFGQFYGRVSHGGTDDVVFPAFVTDAGVPFPRLFRDASAVLSAGDTIPGEGGAQVGGFLAEVSTQPFGPAVSRNSLRGTGVTRRNNEMLLSQAFGKVARKGDPVPGEPAGVVWSAFLGYWPVDVDRVVFLAKLAGPGVGRANDCALYLWQEDLSHLKLLREGDAVGAGDGPRVGGISRVDVNPVSGDYVALTTLTGNRTRNLALFTGDADAGNATTQKALRLPHLRLRKGTLYNSGIGTVTGIRSFILSPATDRGGAGGKGLGQVINDSGQIAVTLQFDNRAVELMTGRP